MNLPAPVSPWWQGIPAERWRGGRSHQRRKHKATEKKGKRRQSQQTQEDEHFRERLENLRQRTLTTNESHHPSEYWGNIMRQKSNDVARICLLNFSGFTLSARSLKDDQLRKFMEEQDVDVILLPEANVCWHKMYHCDRLHEQTFGWFEDIHQAYAYNYKDSEAEKRQYGGVVILTRNNAASRVMESGKDDSGLGRWVWVRYRGRNGIVTCIICCYRPCVPSSNGSTGSVYAQHQRHFNDKADDICPREAFTRDLGIEIQSWLDSGDQLILGLDANEDMRRGPVARMLREKGMSDAVMALHGMNAPPTTDYGS